MILCLCLLPLPARAAQPKKYAALTFDDGPSGRFTRELLEGLAEREVKATFLLCGYRILQYPELTQRIYDEGHEIGCHGFSHDNMSTMSRRDIAQEITDTLALLPDGCNPAFLRPPGGCCSDAVRQVAQARSMAILNWSVDPRDWNCSNAISIERAVTQDVQDGDVILLHDMSDSSVKAALAIVDSLHARGFTFVTVSELARLRGISPQSGRTYTSFPPKENSVK